MSTRDGIMWRHEDDIRQPFTDDKFRTIRQKKKTSNFPRKFEQESLLFPFPVVVVVVVTAR